MMHGEDDGWVCRSCGFETARDGGAEAMTTTEIYTGEDTLSLHDALPISPFVICAGLIESRGPCERAALPPVSR